MSGGEHVSRSDLASYLSDALPDGRADEVRRHLAACPACREDLESVERQLRLLRMLDVPEDPPELPEVADLPPPPPPLAPVRRAMRLRPLAAAVLAVAFLLGLALAARYLPADRYRLAVVVDDRVEAGGRVPILARVTDRATGRPVPGVSVAMAVEEGPNLRGVSDGQGIVHGLLPLPPEEGLRRLRVVARSSLGRSVLEQPLALEEAGDLLLTTDRFRYQPGQAVALRVALVSGRPGRARGPVQLELLGPDGLRRWLRTVEPGPRGVAWTQVPLDPGEAPGPHLLVATAPGARAVAALLVGSPETPEDPVGKRPLPRLVVPGGVLVGGVANEVYVVAGRPGPVHLEYEGRTLEADGGRYGVARFLVNPRRRAVAVRFQAGDGPWAERSVAVQESPSALALALDRALVRAGEPLGLEVAGAAPTGTVVAELRQGERTLARTQGLMEEGRSRLVLPVPEQAGGAAEVRVFGVDPETDRVAAASRRLLVEARPLPVVEMEAVREAGSARVRLQVRGSDGQGIPAVVGLEAASSAEGLPGLPEALDLLAALPAWPAEAAAWMLEQDPALARAMADPAAAPALEALLARSGSGEEPDVATNPSALGEMRLDRVVRQGWAAAMVLYVVALMAMILTDLGRSPWAILPVGVCFLAVLPGLAEPSEIDYRPAVMAASLLTPLLVWASSLTLADLVDERLSLFGRTAMLFVVLLGLMGYGMEPEAGLLDWGLALLAATGFCVAWASLVMHRQEAGPLAALAALGLALAGGGLVFVCLAFPGTVGPELLMLFAQALGVVAWAARADAPWPTGVSAWEPLVVVLFGGTLFAVVMEPNLVRSRAQGQLTACRANLRAVETALASYATDSAGRFPPTLRRLVPEYLQDLPECPAAGRDTYSGGYRAGPDLDRYDLACRGHHHSDVGQGRDRPALSGGAGGRVIPESAPAPPAEAAAPVPGWRPDVAAGLNGRMEVVLPVPASTRRVRALVATLRGQVVRAEADLGPDPGREAGPSKPTPRPVPPETLRAVAGGLLEGQAALRPAAPEGPGRLRVFLGGASQLAMAMESVQDPGVRAAAARLEMAALALRGLQGEGGDGGPRGDALRRAVEGSVQALLTGRGPDGSFAGDFDLTVAALRALAPASRVAPLDPRLVPEAARWVAEHQEEDGSWDGAVGRTARAARALHGAGVEPEAVRRAVAWLAGRDPIQPGDLEAVAALAVLVDPHGAQASRLVPRLRPLAEASPEALEVLALADGGREEVDRGLGSLAARRRADGGFGSLPDTLAAARALAAAASRFDPSARVTAGSAPEPLQAEPGSGVAEVPVRLPGPLVLRSDGTGFAAWQVLVPGR